MGHSPLCLSCHLNTIKPSPVVHSIDIKHACDQCHATMPMPETVGHAEELVSNIPLLETTCTECHKAPEAK